MIFPIRPPRFSGLTRREYSRQYPSPHIAERRPSLGWRIMHSRRAICRAHPSSPLLPRHIIPGSSDSAKSSCTSYSHNCRLIKSHSEQAHDPILPPRSPRNTILNTRTREVTASSAAAASTGGSLPASSALSAACTFASALAFHSITRMLKELAVHTHNHGSPLHSVRELRFVQGGWAPNGALPPTKG